MALIVFRSRHLVNVYIFKREPTILYTQYNISDFNYHFDSSSPHTLHLNS